MRVILSHLKKIENIPLMVFTTIISQVSSDLHHYAVN